MIPRNRPTRKALSLLEMLAVITIIGIISAVVLPRISLSKATAKQNSCWQNKAEINTAVERYFFNQATLPTNTADLSGYFPEGIPLCPVSDGAYTLDATTKRVVGHTTSGGSGKGGGGDH